VNIHYGYVFIEISNIIKEDVLTTLAWDVTKSVSKVLNFFTGGFPD